MSVQYYGLITELPEEDAFLEVTADGQDRLVQVKFADSYSLTVYVDEGGSITLYDILGRETTADHSAALFTIMPSEQPVTAIAAPENGYKFIGWEIGSVIPSKNKTFTFTMTDNTVLRALFEKTQEAYALQYSGTPTEAGEYELQCQDAEGNDVKVIVYVKDTAPPITEYSCYLTRYDKDGSSKTMYLPNIQVIEEDDNAQVTEISTIIYGFDDNFAMDLGTVQSFAVTFDRVQPKKVEDPEWDPGYTKDMFFGNVDYTKQDEWSNAFWFEAFKYFIEGWQNLNFGIVDGEFKQTGGFKFHFEPQVDRITGVSYDDLYPVLDETVIFSGQAQYDFVPNRLQRMRMTLPLVTSTMIPSGTSQEYYTVTYRMYDEEGIEEVFTQTFPKGVRSVVPNVPTEWMFKARGAMFDYWLDNEGIMHMPGERLNKDILTLYGHWTKAKYAFYTDSSDTVELKGGENFTGVSRATMIIIGAGGTGGTGTPAGTGYAGLGGGGGSGAYVTRTASISNESIIIMTEGSSDKESTVTIGNNTYRAAPGSRGHDATLDSRGIYAQPGKGGAGGQPKGVPGTDAIMKDGIIKVGEGGWLAKEEYGVGFENYYVDFEREGESGTIGPFSSYHDDRGQFSQCGVGGDGSSYSASRKPGQNGKVIILLS